MAHNLSQNFISQPLNPIPEAREVFYDDIHYQSEMEKMRIYLREREATIQTQMIEIDTLVSENNFLKSEVNRVMGESAQFKDTLKRMYMVYLDQQKYIHQITSANADLSVKIDYHSDKNASLFNEIQNMTLDKDLHHARLKEGDKKYHYDIQSLTSQMTDKNIELSELRRKVNDLIEIKRRLEEETGALRFTVDTLRSKMESELKEKQMRIEQIERTYSENNSLKTEEIQLLKNKIREQDMLLLKNAESNRAYVGEISSLNKELTNRNYELSKIRPNRSGAFFDTASKENIRGAFNGGDGDQSYINIDNGNQPFNASGRSRVHFGNDVEDFDQDVRQPFQGGYNNSNNQSAFEQRLGDAGEGGNARRSSNANQKNRQTEGARQAQDRMFKDNNKSQSDASLSMMTMGGDNDGDNKQDKMSRILDIAENATRRRLVGLVLQMWKTKFALSIKNRKGGITLQDEKRREETEKASENMLSNSLAKNLVDILAYIRRSSVDILFELYQRSIDASESKKINSLIIFTINLRELKVQFKGVNIILEINYLKDLKSHRPADALVPTITIATGKLWSRQNDDRDQANKWIESTLNQAIEQKTKTSNEEKNKDIIFLFRLLTLKHKVKYPLQGTPYKVDFDLMSVLEHKICDAFRRAVSNEF